MIRYIFLGIFCCFLSICITNRQCAAEQHLPTTLLTIGKLKLNAEIAATPESRARGLMWRIALPADRGMLFVFSKESILTFWMKNTSLPLSIIFVSKDKKIVSIKPLTPYSEKPVSSSYPALYAIELNRTVCERSNIKPGMKVEGLRERLYSGK